MKPIRTILAVFIAALALPMAASAENGAATFDAKSEEIVVFGQKSQSKLRREVYDAEEDFYALFNKLNDDADYDVRCFYEGGDRHSYQESRLPGKVRYESVFITCCAKRQRPVSRRKSGRQSRTCKKIGDIPGKDGDIDCFQCKFANGADPVQHVASRIPGGTRGDRQQLRLERNSRDPI